MHDDDVVGLDRLGDEVGHAAVDALAQPALGEKRRSLFLVLAGQLDVRRALGAGGQELELDRADAAADLEHTLARHVTGERDETARRPAESRASGTARRRAWPASR